MTRKPTFEYEFPRAAVTADVVLFSLREEELVVLLIERRHPPFEGRFAFPGGFVEPDEPPETAAARELHEETGLSAPTLHEVGAFGQAGRDPRGWTVTVAFTGFLRTPLPVQGGDDARSAGWFPVDGLPPLAFDHDDILVRARARLAELVPGAAPVRPYPERSFGGPEVTARLVRALRARADVESRGAMHHAPTRG